MLLTWLLLVKTAALRPEQRAFSSSSLDTSYLCGGGWFRSWVPLGSSPTGARTWRTSVSILPLHDQSCTSMNAPAKSCSFVTALHIRLVNSNDCHQHSVSLTCSYARPCTFDLQSFVLHILQAQEGRVDSAGWRLTNSEHSYRFQWLDIVSLSPDIASFELVGHFHHEERNAAFVSSYE